MANNFHLVQLKEILDEQTKIKVPRELFVNWVESSIDEVHRAQLRTLGVRKTFEKCGLDPYDVVNVLFEKHL